jgi:hypothetical protein
MSVETLADRRIMIKDFGIDVSYIPVSGGRATFKGIFDSDHAFEEIGGSVSFSVSQPRLTCVTADVKEVVEGDVITFPVDNVLAEYVVRVVLADGTGITELQLEKQ